LALAFSAALAATVSIPRVEAADCYWYCDCDGVHCSCGHPRTCPWPPPPIACPTCP
jgi:hypothetical protein